MLPFVPSCCIIGASPRDTYACLLQEMHLFMSVVRLLLKSLDGVARVAAIIAAAGGVLVVLLLGVMLTDDPNRVPLRGILIVLPGFAILGWVIFCAVSPWTGNDLLRSFWSPLRFLLTKGLVYATPCVALYWVARPLMLNYRLRQPVAQLVEPGDPRFPAANRAPHNLINIEGTLPQELPIKEFIAVYAATTCTRRDPLNGEMLPLIVVRKYAVLRKIDHYKVAVWADAFERGNCGWHLRDMTYTLHVKGYRYSIFGQQNPALRYCIRGPRIEVLHRGISTSCETHLPPPRSEPTNVWCWKTDRSTHPYYPISCSAENPSTPIRLTRTEAYVSEVDTILATSKDVVFNFHKFGEGWNPINR